MAELVDALDSKSCIRKDVQVRFLFWAQITADLYRSVFSLVQPYSFYRLESSPAETKCWLIETQTIEKYFEACYFIYEYSAYKKYFFLQPFLLLKPFSQSNFEYLLMLYPVNTL